MRYLLLFTIGPVQSLIGNSRKCHDMYAGSKLLSGLMRDTVCILEKHPRIKVLFPVEAGQVRGDSDMPNRLIAEFTTDDREEPVRYAGELAGRVRGIFMDTCLGCLGKYVGENGLKAAENQLKDFLEVYWIWEPYDGRDYQKAYNRLFERIHVVKSVRTFRQTAEPWNRKCMLFPEYNTIFIRRKDEAYPYNTNKEDIIDLTDRNELQYQLKPGEALSAIGLVKRLYEGSAGRQIHSLRLMLLKSRWGSGDLSAGQGDMLANAVYDMVHGNEPDYSEYDERSRVEAEKLWAELHEKGIRLTSYYALIKFDGDNMGDVFRNCATPEEQAALSRNISEFASETPGIIEAFGGLPVYAGGEDFLGFLPLDKLFACLEKLHWLFKEKVKLTFSAGVVAAHLMQPLKEVAAAAEDMERRAKATEDKNAVVIGIMKRSGENVVAPSLKFGDEPGNLSSVMDLRGLVGELNLSNCSKSLLYHLGNQFRCFLEEDAAPEPEIAEILVQRAARIAAAPQPEELTRRLMVFYKKEDLEGFMMTLNAAAFLSGEVMECSM